MVELEVRMDEVPGTESERTHRVYFSSCEPRQKYYLGHKYGKNVVPD